ncbi:hypothetical protein [Agromyces salentinus]|uniref:Septum formation-related domain-containing protein n=1 Tax=Agromyces salentinus TaxID=269421 RepID=A0ABN2MJA5_9MICO|nr:hypothetical protein [Agromyces salentinus]
MTADRLGGNDADWLLAQLAAGGSPAPSQPSQTPVPRAQPMPSDQPQYANPQSSTQASQGRRAARSEESLDWFSLAEPPAQETATRALPVVGDALPPRQSPPASTAAPAAQSWEQTATRALPVVPPTAQPWERTEARSIPVVQAPASPSGPAFAPPGAYVPPAAAHAPLSVEPPVGRSQAPIVGHEPDRRGIPGPATPTASFALTWGDAPAQPEPSAEDALRDAFRRLSQPDSAQQAAPVAPAQPAATPAAAAPAAAAPAAPVPSPAPVAPEADPFADFALPPVARNSFTPASGTPRAATTDFGADLWSALQEPDPVPIPTQELTRRERLALEQQTSGPEAGQEGGDAAAFTAMPPAAPQGTPPAQSPFASPSPWNSGAETAPTADARTPAVPSADPIWQTPALQMPAPQVPPAAEAPRTPFPAFAAASAPPAPVDQRVEPVDDLLAALGGAQAPGPARPRRDEPAGGPEGQLFGRPYDTPSPQTSRFASFAADTALGQTAAPSRQPAAPSFAPAQGPASASTAFAAPVGMPEAAAPLAPTPVPQGASDGLADLGLSFGEPEHEPEVTRDRFASPVDDESRDVPQYVHAARAWSAVPAEDASLEAEEPEAEDLGYQWGLMPDPMAEDPRADAPAGSMLVALAAAAQAPATGGLADADLVPSDDGAELDPFAGFESDEPSAQTALLRTAPPADEVASDPFADAAPTRQFPQPATERMPRTPAAWSPAVAPEEPDLDDPFASLFTPTGPVAVTPIGAGAAFPGPVRGGAGAGAAAAGGYGAGAYSAGAYGAGAGAGVAFSASSGASTTGSGRAGGTGNNGGSGGGGNGGSGGGGNGRGPGGSGGSGKGGSGGSGSDRRPVKTLIWIAGGLVAVLVLVGLFFLGSQLMGGGSSGGTANLSASESETAEETPSVAPTAPQPMGVHAWNTLFGGECVDPFTSAWDQEYTVVDCGVAHAAQLVYRGTLPGDEAAPYPGESELATQIGTLCTAAGIVDVAAAGGIPDLQVQGSYPADEAQWAEGERTYYCFVNRAGGEPLTGSLAGPGPAA